METPRTYDLDDLMKLAPMEKRVYRLRCIEGWPMVIPWVGFPSVELIKWAGPQNSAKYTQFISLVGEWQMPGVSSPVLDWLYSEGLRLNEVMHPLVLSIFGLYGQVLPSQDGAPVYVVLPWKCDFKSTKPIVKIRSVNKQPPMSWNPVAASEYGFYSNVNPTVDHPRWSQAIERRIGEDKGGFSDLFAPKHKTLMFSGYEQVTSLRVGMDLRRNS